MNARLVWFFSLCGFAAIFSSTLSKTPTLPLFASHLGANDAQVGLIAAASTIPGLFVSYLAGALADRYSWKKILLVSLLVFVTAPLLYLWVYEPWQLAAARFYHGVATAAFAPVALAAVAAAGGARRGEMLAVFTSSTMAGRALAPFLGGLLLASWGFESVFLLCAAAGLAALALGTMLRDGQEGRGGKEVVKGRGEKEAAAAGNEGLFEVLRSLLQNRGFLMVGGVEAAVFFAYGAFEVMFPLFARHLGLPVWQIGAVMGIQLAGVIFLKPVFGRVSDRVGRIPLILAGLALSALSAAAVPIWCTLYGFVLLSFGFGLGFALVTSGTRPLAAELVESGKRGAALGGLATMMDIGQVLGPPAAGLAALIAGYRAAFGLVAVLPAAALLLSLYFVHKHKSFQTASRA
ncbi:MAG: MFS transporter [Bacillota bacterium]